MILNTTLQYFQIILDLICIAALTYVIIYLINKLNISLKKTSAIFFSILSSASIVFLIKNFYFLLTGTGVPSNNYIILIPVILFSIIDSFSIAIFTVYAYNTVKKFNLYLCQKYPLFISIIFVFIFILIVDLITTNLFNYKFYRLRI